MGWRYQGGAIPASIFYTGLLFVWQAIRGTGIFKRESAIESDEGSHRFSDKSNSDSTKLRTAAPVGYKTPSIPVNSQSLSETMSNQSKYKTLSIPSIPEAATTELSEYELLVAEKLTGYRHEALWLKCYSEVDGDQAKAESAYNRQRARMLGDEFNDKQKAEEDSRLAKLKASEAEEKHFLDAVNAILWRPSSELGFDFPGRATLEQTLAKLDGAMPKLVSMGQNELIKKVKEYQTWIGELLKTHEKHRIALERARPLLYAAMDAPMRFCFSGAAPIRKMLNDDLVGRFSDLNYKQFEDFSAKCDSRGAIIGLAIFFTFISAIILISIFIDIYGK